MTTAQITGQAAAQVAIALRTVPARRLDGTDLRSRKFGLEGLIAKRRDSLYESGRRRGAWVKVKLTQEQEFVIGGCTPPVGGRKYFGALPPDRTCFLDLAGDPG